jgi:hypothetical protein
MTLPRQGLLPVVQLPVSCSCLCFNHMSGRNVYSVVISLPLKIDMSGRNVYSVVISLPLKIVYECGYCICERESNFCSLSALKSDLGQ